MNARARHSQALQKARARKAPLVTFVEEHFDYDETTDDHSLEGTTEVTGYVVQLDSDPAEYRDLSLTESEALTLFFVPVVIGVVPKLNAVVEWDGETKVVKKRTPIRPTGLIIAARLVVA